MVSCLDCVFLVLDAIVVVGEYQFVVVCCWHLGWFGRCQWLSLRLGLFVLILWVAV